MFQWWESKNSCFCCIETVTEETFNIIKLHYFITKKIWKYLSFVVLILIQYSLLLIIKISIQIPNLYYNVLYLFWSKILVQVTSDPRTGIHSIFKVLAICGVWPSGLFVKESVILMVGFKAISSSNIFYRA